MVSSIGWRDISRGFYIEEYRYLFEAKKTHSQNNAATAEKTEVFYGSQNAVRKILQFMQSTRRKYDVCICHTKLSLVFEIQEIRVPSSVLRFRFIYYVKWGVCSTSNMLKGLPAFTTCNIPGSLLVYLMQVTA